MSSPKFTVEELVLDDYFRKWVQGKLPPEDTFWETWVEARPEYRELAAQARFVVEALAMDEEVPDAARLRENLNRIITNAEKEEHRHTYPLLSYAWKAAAAIVLLIGGYWYFGESPQPAPVAYEAATESIGLKTIEKINNGEKPLTISLSDGSSITLQPGSRLRYPEEFAVDRREVILSGEAFFDIAGNPARPFLVYANEIVTRVLGTSFSIKAYENDSDVTVKVVTGKVSVLPSKVSGERKGTGVPAEGLILTPNQMAVYARSPEKLTRSLVANPGIVKGSQKKSSDYNFEDTPVAQVFQALEEGYGVPIVYNADQLAKCTVTAPLENENLYEKLDMICKVIRAEYQVIDAQIVITSKGCE